MDEDRVVGMAEAAWPDAKCAILPDGVTADLELFRQVGWTVFSFTSSGLSTEALDQLRSYFREEAMKDHDPKLKIALGADSSTAFSRLPQKQQKKVREFLDKFTANPEAPTHNYEHIHSARDPNLRSVRIDGSDPGIVLSPRLGEYLRTALGGYP